MNAEATFRDCVKGSNFMTPEILRYGRAGPFVYELATGSGIGGGAIFGVTVVRATKHRTDLGRCFSSLSQAEDYISDLAGLGDE